MSGFSIDITGSIDKQLDQVTERVKQIVNDELQAFGLETVTTAKGLAPVDEGFLRNSITFETLENAVQIVVAANYAAYLEFGTRSFAAAYVSLLPATWQEYAATFQGGGGGFQDYFRNIMEWVKRKGIDPKAAYPIAISILRKGIRPHPFLFPAIEENLIKLKQNLSTI